MQIDLSSYGLRTVDPETDGDVVVHPRNRWGRLFSIPSFCLLILLALPAATEYSNLIRLADPPTFGSPSRYEPIIRHYARWYGLDPALLTAIIRVESNFNPRAVSEKGAVGLMQLMPDTASLWHIADPMNPHQNIRGGALQMRYLLHRFGDDLELAIAAYHAGGNKIRRYEGLPPYASTRQYVDRVLQVYDTLREAAAKDL